METYAPLQLVRHWLTIYEEAFLKMFYSVSQEIKMQHYCIFGGDVLLVQNNVKGLKKKQNNDKIKV